MAISFKCQKCAKLVRCSDQWAGKTAKCPGCGEAIEVPADAQAAAPPADQSEQSVQRPCPRCSTSLKLTRKLDGRKVRCTACGTILTVSADPWGVTICPPQQAPVQAQPVQPPTQTYPTQPLGPTDAPWDSLDLPGPAGQAPFGMPQQVQAPALPSVSYRPRRKLPIVPILLIGGFGLAVTTLVVVAAVLWISAGGGRGSAVQLGGAPDAPSPLFFLPDNSKLVVSIDVAAVLASKLYRDLSAGSETEIKKAEDGMFSETGLAFADVKRVTFGGEQITGQEPPIVVVELTKAVEPERLRASMRRTWTEEKIGSATMHVTQDTPPMALHVAGDRLVVFGPPNALRTALQRNRAATFSGPIKEAFEQLDFSRTIAAAMAIPEQMPGAGGGFPALGGMPVSPDMLKKLRAVAAHAHVVGSDVQLAITVLCAEEQAADELQKMVDGLLAMTRQMGKVPPEAKKTLDSLKISRLGRNLKAQISVDGAQILAPFLAPIQAAREAARRSAAQRAKVQPAAPPKMPPR